MDAGDSDRLARLEREVAILRAEFAKLRERMRAPASAPPADSPRNVRFATTADTGPASEPPVAAATPRRRPTPIPSANPPHSFEQAVGRYGTIAVATITVLVGVGIFLNWAIERHLLSPEVRVVLGYLGAIGLAIGGIRLRIRGTREFGNVLLAMALGIVHLVCWSAGPLLHVLPSSVALAIGFVASMVLTEFALRHEEEALCAIGFGGAALAPFITSEDSTNVLALAVYGVIVLALSAAALRDRPWEMARNVTMGSFAVYVVALATTHAAHTAWPQLVNRLAILFPITVLLAIIPLTHSRHRRTLVRFATAGVAVGGLLREDHSSLWSIVLIVGAAVIAIGALDLFRSDSVEREAESEADPEAARRNAFIDALALPLVLFLAAIVATPLARSTQSATMGAVWAVLALFMTHRNRAESEGDMYATTAALTALWIVPAAFSPDQEFSRVLGAVVMGIALLLVGARMARQPLVAGGLASLAIASLWALAVLDNRPSFSYVPFVNWASIVTVIVIGGWLVALRITGRAGFLPMLSAQTRATLNVVVVIGAAGTAFLWGRAELVGAWNATASTALLIMYYAATGTLMIWLGRERHVKSLRVIGLLLTLLAAGKALVEAFHVPNVAVRITVFFAVSAFLIAVGYWYRGGADGGQEPLTPRPSMP